MDDFLIFVSIKMEEEQFYNQESTTPSSTVTTSTSTETTPSPPSSIDKNTPPDIPPSDPIGPISGPEIELTIPGQERKYSHPGLCHYSDVRMGKIASQITSLTIVYSTVYSDADQRKHQSSASLAFERRIHRGSVNSPHKWLVIGKCFHLMTSSWFD